MPQYNVLVAQSGGPSPVINNSLRGVVETCMAMPEHFGSIYAALHGIEGVLKEELLDLSAQDAEEIALLRTTPAAGAIGTCRYKLRREQDFERVIAVLRAHQIGYFFYIGGNDSMDTANKIARLAREKGMELVVTGVPKTIDNDVGDSEFRLVDHTPGYGSAARYWALTVQNLDEENRGSYTSAPVLVVQVMGRRIGFIPAASRLGDPERQMPLLIFMAESGLSLEDLADRVADTVREHRRAIVIVSEGFDVGDIGARKDAFGHTMFSASRMTVAQCIVNYLNEAGLPARGNMPGTLQRHDIIYASTVDLEEAYQVGQQAVFIALKHGTGYMATILRDPGPLYRVHYDKVPLEVVANSERTFPASWILPSRTDVSDEFVHYARPLIGEDWPSVPLVNGLQRFARFKPIFAEKKVTIQAVGA